ncbi:unnamed protein product [Rotaria sp. Silwood2]|nr:unnamed protein product [Rotaria sp. Silwood2]CAF2513709.1 unnamed protein product [Rotaria sp. Silwood2]CAF2876337.1 unnamed protein product [Rotaria sp. Silwood2]CAF3880124.1 unnamed protein product [Rotaria sp. Silwood2]CAF3949956.1 unnamed protein product [Rotaria sp. Silwood2]
MTTLQPRGYGGLPSFQFSPPNRAHNRYYNDRYPRYGTSFSPHFPTPRFYQPPFYPNERYTTPGFYQDRRSGFGRQLATFLYRLDDQVRYEQYLRRLEKIQRQYGRLQNNNYATSLPWNSYGGNVYEFEKETKYVPVPVFLNPNTGQYEPLGNSGLGFSPNIGYPGGMNLPPKIRVIFIPTGQSSLQQPWIGPLTTPPFLYNRIAQPLHAFPLPPPLPQLGSLPLTPAVQQMVIQRYSNPVAVLPCTPSWQMSQLMMPIYPQFSQAQPMVPISAFEPFSTAAQSYIPPLMPTFPYLPPAPQPCIPNLMPAFPSLPPAPQLYLPPPSSMPMNQCMLSPPSSQLPLPDTNVVSSFPQYFNSNYPSMCRACPPVPPSLNISVTGHCWVQHCAACHHVPTSISNSYVRPASGRITPLLRYPTVPQYVPDQTIQQQQYFQNEAPILMRPWLRKTPPLPPGAILISDEYVTDNRYSSGHDRSRRRKRRPKDSYYPAQRATTVASKTVTTVNPTAIKVSRSISPRRSSKTHNNRTQNEAFVQSNNIISNDSSSTTTSDVTVEYQKVTLHSSKPKENDIPEQLVNEARNINFQYNYQPQELPSVYLVNQYLKSNSEDSTLTASFRTLSDCSPSLIKENIQTSSSSSNFSPMKEEANSEKEDEKSTHPPSQIKKPKERLIIIREFMTSSPSTMSTISSNSAFSIIDKDIDIKF